MVREEARRSGWYEISTVHRMALRSLIVLVPYAPIYISSIKACQPGLGHTNFELRKCPSRHFGASKWKYKSSASFLNIQLMEVEELSGLSLRYYRFLTTIVAAVAAAQLESQPPEEFHAPVRIMRVVTAACVTICYAVGSLQLTHQ
jgi:hypothetical protein